MSAREPQSKEIDGIKITTIPLAPVTVGKALGLYTLAPRVMRLVMPLMGQLGPLLGVLGGVRKDGAVDETEIEKRIEALMKDPKGVEKLAPLLEGLATGLSLPENASLPADLLCRTQADVVFPDGKTRRVDINTAEMINEHLSFFTLLKVMWFVAGVNFGGFFGGASPNGPIKG